ncbi:outer membrane beta-barrel protein [Winogradskyella flava]|uniref:Porin family protein n=1 Tax=Winogradskyella flava TaxID=1884876 RepID=A0A842IWN3_9FLAO|nr:outer membrane beta-barrel protein [Winogradskyella flava]MBC2845198.1 porin family protein [Winogradskyella flava]
MKYNVLFVLLLMPSFCLAQEEEERTEEPTEKGNWFIGAGSNFFFNSTNSKIETAEQDLDAGNTLNITLGAGGGYFIIDNLLVGVELPVSFSRFKDDDIDFERKITSFIASPFVRYYFNGSNIRPFVQANIGFGSSKTTIEDNSVSPNPDPVFQASESKSTVFQYSVNGGIAIIINDKVSVDLGVGYSQTNSEPEDSDLKFKNSTIGFLAGFNIFI